MSHYRRHILLLLILETFICQSVFSQTKTGNYASDDRKTRILFIVDCSHNMNERWQSATKIKITQMLLSNIVDSMSMYDNTECALRVFGNEKDYSSGDCDDTHLLVPFYRKNSDNIKAKLKALVPMGTSAVAKSLQKAAEDFPKERNCRNIVIMIVDNIDKCDGDVAEISRMMQKHGSYIKPFIIGISKGMKNNYDACGHYYEAKGEIEFSYILNNVVKQALHNTTLQIHLLDSKNAPTETEIPIMLYDNESKELKYSFIHGMNQKGMSDTLYIDPLIRYDVVVATLPEVRQNNLTFQAGQHNTVTMYSPQGTLYVKYNNSSKTYAPKTYPVAVKRCDDNQTVNVQQLNTKEKYLTGKYDLEVMTLPLLRIDSVEITQSSVTTIEIPECGILKIEKKNADLTADIFVKRNSKYEFVKNIAQDNLRETLDLLPGEYIVVAKSKSLQTSSQSMTFEFKIESNKTTAVTLAVKK